LTAAIPSSADLIAKFDFGKLVFEFRQLFSRARVKI
jgi:hypothetical protein